MLWVALESNWYIGTATQGNVMLTKQTFKWSGSPTKEKKNMWFLDVKTVVALDREGKGSRDQGKALKPPPSSKVRGSCSKLERLIQQELKYLSLIQLQHQAPLYTPLRWPYCLTINGCNFVSNDLLHQTLISYNGPWFTFPFMHIW